MRQVPKDGASVEELLRGPFDLLRWYQGFFLEAIAERLAISRRRFVEAGLPANVAFTPLCARVRTRLGAWPDPQTRGEIETGVTKLENEFKAAGAPSNLDERYRSMLGYLLLNLGGRVGFATLLGDT